MVCLWTPLHTPLTYPDGANLTPGPVVRSTAKLIRLRKTCKSERAAQIAFGQLLERAAAGRKPDSDLTVARLDQ